MHIRVVFFITAILLFVFDQIIEDHISKEGSSNIEGCLSSAKYSPGRAAKAVLYIKNSSQEYKIITTAKVVDNMKKAVGNCYEFTVYRHLPLVGDYRLLKINKKIEIFNL